MLNNYPLQRKYNDKNERTEMREFLEGKQVECECSASVQFERCVCEREREVRICYQEVVAVVTLFCCLLR